jgi:uncharacterized protein YcbK (DUF882 family)
MKQLTPNFSQEEFACHCCGALPTLASITRLVLPLQELRNIISFNLSKDCPIIINSGYRCVINNKFCGGSPKSMHLQGLAADIRCPELSIPELHAYCLKIHEFRGIGIYTSWIHVDLRTKPATWDYTHPSITA